MFRALALCWGVKANTPYEVRDRIVYRLCDYVSEDGNTETFVSFMEKVHRKYLKWEKYWGEDCKSLLTTIGLNMNMVSVVTCEGLETCRAVLCGYPLSRILDFLCGETTASYRERISYPEYGRGDYPELVAAGQIWKRHIVVLQPVPSQNIMTETRIDYAGLEVCESKTTYLVRVNDNHYHACEFQKDRQNRHLGSFIGACWFLRGRNARGQIKLLLCTCTCVATRFGSAPTCTDFSR
jgi:hypothetical protein